MTLYDSFLMKEILTIIPTFFYLSLIDQEIFVDISKFKVYILHLLISEAQH